MLYLHYFREKIMANTYDLENFKYYDLYDASYNAEGMDLDRVKEEIKFLQASYKISEKKDRPLIAKRIDELESDKRQLEKHAAQKSTNLVGFCSFSNEIFKLARRLARTIDPVKRLITQTEIADLISSLNDENFAASHRTTRATALRRIGILMTTEENPKVFKELKENLYHIPEVKQGLLNPYKYYKKINHKDSEYSARKKEIGTPETLYQK